MKGSNSNKDPKASLSEAHKGVIIWLERELRRKALKQQGQHIVANSSTPAIDAISLEDSLPNSTSPEETSTLSQTHTEETINSLQKNIQDLQIQRRELDIAIKVLKKHSQQVSSNLRK